MSRQSPEEQKRARESQDLRDMARPADWPMWPFLPLKRHVNGNLECAYMLAQDGKLTSIFHGNMFHPAPDTDREQVYADLRAIVADGWIVD